jgi:hypothetical protein
VNAAIVLMTSAWMAGADPAPPTIPAPTPAPGAIQAAPIGAPLSSCGNGCGAGCSGAHDECPRIVGERPNLLSKLRSKFGGSGCNTCGPVYTGFTTAGCDPCVGGSKHATGLFSGGGGLFSRWRSRSAWGGDCCDPCISGHSYLGAPAGCSLPPSHNGAVPAAPVVQPAPMPETPTPAPMPMSQEPPKDQPTLLTIPTAPSPVVTPVSIPKSKTPLPLGGAGNPF